MRIVTALSMVAGSVLATLALTSMVHRETSYTGIEPSAIVQPASLLVKDHAGWPANMERKPLSVIGNWRIECDGSLYDYRGITLGSATDRAHEMGCKSWEVSAIDGFDWK